jgi:hypothetical protein
LCRDGDLAEIKEIFESDFGLKYEKQLVETKDKDKKTALHLVRSFLHKFSS